MSDFLSSAFWLQMGGKVMRIAAIIFTVSLTVRFARVVIDRFFLAQAGLKSFNVDEKRARTLSGLVQSIARYSLYFIAIVLVLQEFSIDTTSLIAGAGIVGLALGVGAQSLIRDFMTGFFIILEDQYAIGDYIEIGNIAGTVEEMGFRVTKLRDGNGVLHIIPNGQISRVSNHTRGTMQALVNVPVSYEADLAQVMALLNQACTEVAAKLPEVIEGPKVVGVVDLRTYDLVIRLVAKTVPLEQVKVEAALRQRIKELFDAAQVPPPAAPAIRDLAEQGGK